MRLFFLFFLYGLILTLNIHATSPEAKNYALLGEYNRAIEIYTHEIEIQHDDRAFSLYNERGDLYFAKEEYLLALQDYQKVISQIGNETWDDKSNLLRAICGTLFCYECLNERVAAENEFKRLVKEVALIKNQIGNIIWIKNNPFYHDYKKNIEDHIASDCIECGKYSLTNRTELTADESCTLQCNGYAVAAYYACSRVPNAAIQFLCIGCIFGLEQACLRCCRGEGFWENCVRSLRRLYHNPENPNNPSPHPYE